MRRIFGKLAGFASACLTAVVLLGCGTFILFDSDYGKGFLEQQVETVAARLLGDGYVADVGRQSIGLDALDRLTIRWGDVEIRRNGVAEPQAKIRSITLGLDAPALLGRRVSVRSLDVSGVHLDVTSAPAAAEVAAAAQGLAPAEAPATTPPMTAAAAKTLLPSLTGGLLGRAEQQIALLRRVGIHDVTISDLILTAPVAPGGGPFVMRVERVAMNFADPRAMRLAGALGVDEITIPIRAEVDFEPDSERLVAARSEIGPIQLGRLLPPAAVGDWYDVRPFASTSDMMLTAALTSRPADNRRLLRLGVELGPGRLQRNRGHTEIEAAAVAFDYVEGEDRIVVGPNHFRAQGFEATFSGSIAPVYDRPTDGGFNGFRADIDSTRLVSSIGSADGSATSAALRLAVRTDLAGREMRLTDFEFRSGDGSLAGTAQVRYGGVEPKTEFDLTVDNLAASAVKAFWPFDVAIAARRWVHENVGDAGHAVNGKIAFDMTRARLAEMSRRGAYYLPGELELAFSLNGLKVRTFGDLPDLDDAGGTVATRGSDTLVTIGKAVADGMPDVVVDGGTVRFTRVADARAPRTQIKLVANVTSRLNDVVAIAALPPLNSVSSLPLKPDEANGTVRTIADIDLLIGEGIGKGRALQGWRLAFDLEKAGAEKPLFGRLLSDFNGNLQLDPTSLRGKIDGRLDGAKAEFEFRRALGADPPDEPRMEVGLRFDGGELVKLAPALQDIVAGPIQAKIVENEVNAFQTTFDLSGSALDFPWVSWRKGKGVAANLAFDVRLAERDIAIDDILLEGEGFSANGRAKADREGVRTVELRKVALNPGDDVEAKLERVQNGFTVDIRGAQFDARPLLADIRNNIGAKTAKPPKRGADQFDVTAVLAKVTGFGEESIDDFALNYAGSGSSIAALSVTGKTRKGAAFALDVSPRGEGRSVEISAQDMGALLDFTGAYDRMENGGLSLLLLGSFEDGYEGRMEARNFTLVDEPRLSRLVGAPPSPNSQSLSQAVGRDLRTRRVTFDHASAKVTFGKNGLGLADGIIRGPAFGSSFAGTLYDPKNRIDVTGSFMPAYGLNRVFGAIPIFGQILGNGREGGLIGITYRLSGNFSSPKLEINPISAIAPGIFRNIFAYQ